MCMMIGDRLVRRGFDLLTDEPDIYIEVQPHLPGADFTAAFGHREGLTLSNRTAVANSMLLRHPPVCSNVKPFPPSSRPSARNVDGLVSLQAPDHPSTAGRP